jgi:hypothetical protein
MLQDRQTTRFVVKVEYGRHVAYIPSDLYGVIYTEMDSAEGWKRKLARELKAAGFNFDAAKV